MTLRNKFIITAILLLLSLVAGSYLSGFILLQWLGLDKTKASRSHPYNAPVYFL